MLQPQRPNLDVVVIMGTEADTFADETEQAVSYEEFLSEQATAEPEDQLLGGPMFYTSGTTGHPKGVKSGLSQTGAPVDVLKMIGEGISGMLGIASGGRELTRWSCLPFCAMGLFISPVIGRHERRHETQV